MLLVRESETLLMTDPLRMWLQTTLLAMVVPTRQLPVAKLSTSKLVQRFRQHGDTRWRAVPTMLLIPVIRVLWLHIWKKVGDATTDVGYGAGWFKIYEAGLTNVASQNWAVTDLIAAGGVQQIPIPACIANGQYLLRAEIIALHGAGSSGGAQFYMECAQINVSGGSGAKSPATVSLPGAYKASDPGILINIYQTLSSYTIPGPAKFTCWKLIRGSLEPRGARRRGIFLIVAVDMKEDRQALREGNNTHLNARRI